MEIKVDQNVGRLSRRLEVTGLTVEYETSNGAVPALEDVSLKIERDEIVGIVGESGSGKSTLALAIMRALPENAKIVRGKITFGDFNVLSVSENELSRKIRWKEIAIIPQASMNIFDPLFTVKEQIVETIRVHSSGIPKESVIKQAEQLMELVGIETKRSNSYPHQLSGGMKQRAAIALALALSPALLIADEPTTALDVIVQAQVMSLLMKIREKFGMSLILISHDIALVAQYCERIVIVYSGKIVEEASTADLFQRPLHPYTSGLLQSVPNLFAKRSVLKSIPISAVGSSRKEKQCNFASRCSYAVKRCQIEEPLLLEVSPNHYSACFEWKRLAADKNE